MANIAIRSRQMFSAGLCLAGAVGIASAVLLNSLGSAPRVLAGCTDTDTEDSFSMSCVPSVMPDTSDQLTEQEVAEPGFNGGDDHGGGGGGGGHGGKG